MVDFPGDPPGALGNPYVAATTRKGFKAFSLFTRRLRGEGAGFQVVDWLRFRKGPRRRKGPSGAVTDA